MDTDFDAKFDHFREVREQLGMTSVWSIYEVDNLSERHPFEGAEEVAYCRQDHFGDKTVAVKINGATWAALYVAANACIRESGDAHHIFIEQFQPSSVNRKVLFLHTGS